MECLSSSSVIVSSVRKRDGRTVQAFQREKIRAAVLAAWKDCRKASDDANVDRVVSCVCQIIPAGVMDVETIQDAVETSLMRLGFFDVAKAYILYRDQRAQARLARRSMDPDAVADYVFLSKYARFREEDGRRETYREAVARVRDMHVRRYPALREEIFAAFELVAQKKVLPSMRTMQFGGPAVEVNHCRAFNCCATHIDRPRAFGDILWLLLCGSGVGFSVQYDHVAKLPRLAFVNEDNVVHHTIADKIEGWADALHALVQSYIDGSYIEFDYSQIRRKGATLRTSGGKAPGHLALKRALEQIRGVLHGAQGRKLRPIECYDMACHAADAVLSGGIRRSAMICLFSIEDSEMLHAKTGDWHSKHGWRQNSNNSVALLRKDVKESQFRRVFEATKEWGEPGFVFLDDINYMFNPCVEAALDPRLRITEENLEEARRRIAPSVQVGEMHSGFAFCNLTSHNPAACGTEEEFVEAARAASLIGTLQAGYTHMPYLGGVSEMIAERDALIGVSMTGILDNAKIACDPKIQRRAAAEVIRVNEEIAAKIGIRSAARTTCVKPEGTGSLVLGGVASGHHAHHAERYIRRVTADPQEPVFQFFRSVNPLMCVQKPNGTWVIEFLVQAPPNAVLKENLSAISFLEMVKSTQENWVLPGTARSTDSPGLNHNVSNTVHVREHEWADVADYLWENRAHFTAVSLFPDVADKLYSFAPYEKISTPQDEIRWNQIVSSYKPVDYLLMREESDTTNLTAEAACAGGSCEVSF